MSEPRIPRLDLSETFQARYEAYRRRVEDGLERLLPAASRWPEPIHEAMRYAVFSGGKRLRPVLTLAACELAGGSVEAALPAACAVELVHTYSLVHDDLPAMDDDDMRRGRPTVHVAYDEATAILAGDALLTLAFTVLADPDGPLTPAVALRIAFELGTAAGTAGLIAGQVADLAAEGAAVDGRELERIHRHKTGALFRACARIGAIAAGAGPADVERLSRFADEFGLAFQITDDILDVVGDEAATGRPAGSDERRGKTTFASLYGVETARRLAVEAAQRAAAELEPFGARAGFLRDLAFFAVSRSG
ncbi:MAG: polyprenyl synthetase family protein [Thermaerobacter sp.]|nr:geranyl transferase [Bacillota bacterium]